MKGRLKKESCEKLLNAYRKAIEAGQGDIADALEGIIVDEMNGMDPQWRAREEHHRIA